MGKREEKRTKSRKKEGAIESEGKRKRAVTIEKLLYIG